MTRHLTVVPDHLAIIMDGNGRWATQRGRPRWMGHVRGAQTVRKVVTHCARRGVGQLTLYAFSSDNWKRPQEEVKLLFELFATHLDRQLPELISNDIRLTVIGRRDRLPRALAERIDTAEARTQSCRRMHLRVAVDYSSRAAIQTAAASGALERVTPDRSDATDASILPSVDMVLRTGGERRLSDFLLWESAYAELAFLDVNFPDLTAADLDTVFADYAARDRRFGGVNSVDHLIKESA
jgi:undecaprenyl diphosphate synthase